MMDRLLVATPLDVLGSPNSRTHHLIRHLAPHFRQTVVISRTNNTHRSRREQWSALVRIRTLVREEESIRWLSVSPWGNIRHALGLHLLGLPSPYAVPRGRLRRALRRLLSSMGVVLDLGVFPSLLLTYAARIGGRLDMFIAEGPWEALLGILLRVLRRVRVVVYDDIDYQPGFQSISGLRRWIIVRLEQFGVRRADLVISVGERLANLRLAQGARQVRVLPNGVDVARFRAATRLRWASGPRRPTAIYMGYLGAWAGVDLLLEAVALVARRLPDIRLIVLGHGMPLDLSAFRDAIRERRLEGNVEFRGEMAYSDLPVQLAEADVGLAMFRPLDLTRYAFPLKVVEYLAAGLPVVTTADTEAADLVTQADAGEAAPFDASAVAQRIIALLQDQERSRRYAKNAEVCSRAYDWEAIMARYASALEDCSGTRAASAEHASGLDLSRRSEGSSPAIPAWDEKQT